MTKQAKEELGESEARYRAILTHSDAGLAEVDLTGQFRFVSDRYCEIVGRPREELLKMRMRDITHREDLAKNIELFERCAAEGTPFTIEKRYIHRDGFNVWVNNNVSAVLDREGRPRYVLAVSLDITERKRTEEVLRENQQRLEFTLESAHGGDWDLDLLTGKAHCSFRHDQCFGATEPIPDWTYEKFVSHVHPDDRANEERKFQAAVSSGEDWNIDCRVVWPDGSVHWIESSGRNSRYVAGKPTRMLGLVRDVTDRKRAELNLAFLAEISHDLARLTSIDKIMQTIGAKIGAFLNLSLCVFAEINEAADEAAINHSWHRAGVPDVSGVHRIGEFVTGEFQRANRAGETFVVHDTTTDQRTNTENYAAFQIGSLVSVPLIREGQWRFLLAIFDSKGRSWRNDEIELMRELTARIWTRLERAHAEERLFESQEQYRSLVWASAQIVWTTNANGAVEEDSPTWREFTGQTIDEWKGFGWLDAIHADDRERVQIEWQKHVDERAPIEIEYRLRHKSGKWRWTVVRGAPLLNADGSVQKWVGMNTDITERKSLEQQITGQNEILEAVALGAPLEEILHLTTKAIERQLPDARCSVLLANADATQLFKGSARALPEEYNAAIDGIAIGEGAGSCGTAAFRRETVIVSDILNDHLWAKYRDLARVHHLRACWSHPIISPDGKLLGTFATYFREALHPHKEELAALESAASVAGIAIERKLAEEKLRESEERFRNLADNMSQFAWMADTSGWIFWYNERWYEYTGTTLEECRAGVGERFIIQSMLIGSSKESNIRGTQVKFGKTLFRLDQGPVNIVGFSRERCRFMMKRARSRAGSAPIQTLLNASKRNNKERNCLSRSRS